MNILAADIGGTHSRFAHFTVGGEGALSLTEMKWLRTAEAASFRQLIDNLRASKMSLRPEDADIVAIAIAGPVESGIRSSPPLISWDIDLSEAERDFGFRNCALINDFVAQAFACISEAGRSADGVLPGEQVGEAALAVIGAGTGLGHCALVPDGRGGYTALPSEAGHSNFAFVSKRECEYQEFLLSERGELYITGNTVVSGRGLSYIHRFLTGEDLSPREVAARFPKHPETLEWAARFYGRACRNYALQVLAMGGLYIAGGVAAKSPELVYHKAFAAEFRSSDTLAPLLAKIPVYLIKDENSGLWGSAEYGIRKLKASSK
jgi:glucokinase